MEPEPPAPSVRRYTMTDMKELPTANRQYKARLFEMIFSQKKELLELYEHQSTFNPNIPLRLLLYIADLYSRITRKSNLYGSVVVPIPTPNFIVFYNGKDEYPDRMTLKLSDMYQVGQDQPKLELQVMMLNINRGDNEELLASCKTLADYAEYTAKVRDYAASMSLDEAVERAITECISEGILSEFLTRFRAEAKRVSIYEYNEEEHMRMEREEHYAKGQREERARRFIRMICKKMKKGNTVSEIADILELDEATVQTIYDIAADSAPEYDEEQIIKKYLEKERNTKY